MKKNLKRLTPEELVQELLKDNTLETMFDTLNLWDKFFPADWFELLSSKPKYTKKAKNTISGWATILILNPLLVNECICWNKFRAFDWAELLKKHPQFANKCNTWKLFADWNWLELLKFQPQFIDKAKEFINGWIAIIQLFPEKIEEFNKEFNEWEKLSSPTWQALLESNSKFKELAKKYKNGQLALIVQESNYINQCDKIEDFTPFDWCSLFLIHPTLIEKCNIWGKFDVGRWRDAICFNQKLLEKAKEYTAGWVAILIDKPELAGKCDKWEAFDDEEWELLLNCQPQFADRRPRRTSD